jgi:hypothetical protein
MGKTAAARMIGFALMSDGWEVHDCTRPAQLLDAIDAERHQVFIADDAFGSTEYRPDASERWARELPAILAAMDERHWLIWTSRPTPLKAGLHRVHQERGTERFPTPAQVHVDAADLDTAEKAMILFRHALAARLPEMAVGHVRNQGVAIVDHPHFTPERIRRFVQVRLPGLADRPLAPEEVSRIVAEEIERPTEAMAASFRALDPLHKAVLLAMLDSPPGVVSERELAGAARRHAPSGLEHSIAELVESLTDHFLRRVPPTSVAWVHPSWRDLVIEELAAESATRRAFLRVCGPHGALLAISTGGGPTGTRSLPLMKDDADWDAVGDRMPALVRSADEREMVEIMDGLRAACSTDDQQARSELCSLGGLVLSLAAGNRSKNAPVSVAFLESWLRLSESLPDAQPPPWIRSTWMELRPERPPHVDSPIELSRYEDWLTLVEVLQELRPDELGHLGFHGERQLEIADHLASAVERRIEEEDVGSIAAERLRRLLWRVARVFDMPIARPLEVADIEAVDVLESGTQTESAVDDYAASVFVARILADLT